MRIIANWVVATGLSPVSGFAHTIYGTVQELSNWRAGDGIGGLLPCFIHCKLPVVEAAHGGAAQVGAVAIKREVVDRKRIVRTVIAHTICKAVARICPLFGTEDCGPRRRRHCAGGGGGAL